MKAIPLVDVLLVRIKDAVEARDKLYHDNTQLKMELTRAKTRITELEEYEWMYKDLCE